MNSIIKEEVNLIRWNKQNNGTISKSLESILGENGFVPTGVDEFYAAPQNRGVAGMYTVYINDGFPIVRYLLGDTYLLRQRFDGVWGTTNEIRFSDITEILDLIFM